MTDLFEVGDLVRDKLNKGDGAYGLGVIVAVDSQGLIGEAVTEVQPRHRSASALRAARATDADIPGKRYDVYFNKFERTITFHGDYLEKV